MFHNLRSTWHSNAHQWAPRPAAHIVTLTLGPWCPIHTPGSLPGPGGQGWGVRSQLLQRLRGGRAEGGGSRASVWLHPEAPGELPADLALAPPPQHSHLSLPAETVGLGRRASVCGHVLTELEKQQAGQDPAVLEKGDSGFPPITAGEASPGRTEAQGRFPESHVCRRPRPPAAVHVLCSSGPAEGTAPGEAGRRAEGEQARGLAEEDPLAANHKTRAFKQNSELRQRDTRHWTWKLLSV